MTNLEREITLTQDVYRKDDSTFKLEETSSNKRKRGVQKKGRKKNRSIKAVNVCLGEYEVEAILKHQKSDDKVTCYFVKWKGWPLEDSTWEPLDNLRSSLALIADYYQNRTYPGKGELVFKCHVESLRKQLSELSDDDIDLFCGKYLTEFGHTIGVNEVEVEERLVILSRIPPYARDSKMMEELGALVKLMKFKKKRERQINLLLEWEREVNRISTDSAPIKVYNSTDLDCIPANFHYVNYNIPDFDVEIPDDNPIHCECKSHCFSENCCWNGSSPESPYSRKGLIKFPKGTPIFECNKFCKCGPNCGNRILQNGRTIPVAIHKTPNGCGWGVKTLVDIKKGQFVVEYVGEVIKFDVAEIRGKNYDRNGCTYLFDLDFDDQTECPYTVDAAFYGNVSHFINHSCDPNLIVYAVWVDCIDRNLPRLGLYAARNIKAFEELSFDYMMEKPTPKKKRDSEKQIICRCESKMCRKIVF